MCKVRLVIEMFTRDERKTADEVRYEPSYNFQSGAQIRDSTVIATWVTGVPEDCTTVEHDF